MKEGDHCVRHVSGSVQGGNNRIGGLAGANYGGEILLPLLKWKLLLLGNCLCLPVVCGFK